MKKILSFCFLLLTFVLINAQSFQQNIKRDYIAYTQFVIEKKFDQALKYTDPKIFEFYSREQFKTAMEAIFETSGLELKLTLPSSFKISEVKNIDKIDYVKMNVISFYEMKIAEMDFDNVDEETIEYFVTMLEEEYGEGNVVFDKETQFFKITDNSEVVASSLDNKMTWKFLVIDPNLKSILGKIIPKEILN